MKILHCADIHLDSAMTSNLDKEKARERKKELLAVFKDMVGYAANENIKCIIIAGDLFDTRNVSAGARKEVYNIIVNSPDIQFYYLQGNHDDGSFISSIDEIPDNLKMFGKQWTSYKVGHAGQELNSRDIYITGVELDAENAGSVYCSLSLNVENYNIVVMHGQEASHISKNNAQIISLNELRNKGIDYLALGHVHEYSMDRLDARGIYCYPGCLEGRGFDEPGEHGFVVLDIDDVTGKTQTEFIPFARRHIYVSQVDVSDCESTFDMEKCIRDYLENEAYPSNSLVKIELTGAVDVETDKDIIYLTKRFEDKYYYFRIKDDTTYKVDYMSFEHDVSLKGEFIRNVMARADINEEDKSEIIRYGLQALRGEDIG